jgi:hypothetical protein
VIVCDSYFVFKRRRLRFPSQNVAFFTKKFLCLPECVQKISSARNYGKMSTFHPLLVNEIRLACFFLLLAYHPCRCYCVTAPNISMTLLPKPYYIFTIKRVFEGKRRQANALTGVCKAYFRQRNVTGLIVALSLDRGLISH